MKTGTVVRTSLLLILALVLAVSPATAEEGPIDAQASLGSGFTYQGRLLDGGVSANGVYDIGFGLYDAALGGALIASDVCEDVNVVNGLFSVTVDFGYNFDGTAYWLQLSVRPGASDGEYTTLEPRTALNPYPQAMTAHVIETDRVSTFFVPAAHGVLHAASTSDSGGLRYYGQGAARLVSNGSGTQDVVFPVSLPGTLYGSRVTIERMYLGYISSVASADINYIDVYRAKYDGSYRAVYSWSGTLSSTVWEEFEVEIPEAERTLNMGDGFLAVRVRCTIPSGEYIAFSGIELHLAHQ